MHQTASQTLDTQTGGMYRGDCDDLSELYFEIAQRQGRTAHLIGLPAHAALAWAVGDVRGWSTYVLHTGQPRRFTAPTLRESLERAYKSFGAGEVLDFTKLELLLRFSGENTRSSWYLSDRVFADPGYARAMIDVQRDWHFQTYQRAIVKMRHMLRDGDVDAGNLSELAGLYHYTGQYARAADTLADAVASAGSAQTRLSMQIDRLHALYRSGQRERADALARALRSEQIPELEGQMDQPLIEPRISLVDGLIDFRANPALGLEVLAEDVAPRVDPLVVQLGGILADQPGAEWTGGPEDALRYQLRWYVSTIVRALSVTRDSALREHPARAALAASAARWIESVGFRDLDSSESVLARYAVLGRLHRGTRGAGWEAQLRVAAPLEEVHIDHTARSPASEALDLSWIAASPTYWSGELAGLFAERHASVDTSRVPELVDRVIATRARAVALGLDHPNFDATERDALLLRALVEQDAGLLRRLLREVRIAADRRERMDVSTWIATVARAVPLEWYRQVIEIFREELNYKPMYFWIAWNAALLGAHPQALHVADVAAAEFPDDPAFAEERDSMWGRFSSEARGTARASAR
jgi:hypothetical protein